MISLKKITDERDALLAEIRRIRKSVESFFKNPNDQSLGKLKREIDRPSPSHLFNRPLSQEGSFHSLFSQRQ